MPAWNEAEGLPGFILELNQALADVNPRFVVVDDCSTDQTSQELQTLANSGIYIQLHRNPVNEGHGPSTLTALRLGLNLNVESVVAIDGDGQFLASDVARILRKLQTSGAQVVEGVRVSRGDPVYRRLVSLATRLLVASRAHTLPRDANTPLRAYRVATLNALLASIPPQAATPNLLISALSRRQGLQIVELEVLSIPRRGSDSSGTTWGKTQRNLPNRRFLKFCRSALVEWIRTGPLPISRESQS